MYPYLLAKQGGLSFIVFKYVWIHLGALDVAEPYNIKFKKKTKQKEKQNIRAKWGIQIKDLDVEIFQREFPRVLSNVLVVLLSSTYQNVKYLFR